jgi:hypothetical protein
MTLSSNELHGSPCNCHSVLKDKIEFPSHTELGEILHWRFTHNAWSLEFNANEHSESRTLRNDLNFHPLFSYFLADEGTFGIQSLHISLTSSFEFRVCSYCKCQPVRQVENEIWLAFYTFFFPVGWKSAWENTRNADEKLWALWK